MRHRHFISCLAVGLGLAIASLTGAGTATASDGPAAFLYDVRNNGQIAGPDDQLIALGTLVCQDLGNDVPSNQTIRAIYDNSNLSSVRDAQFIYESALLFLC